MQLKALEIKLLQKPRLVYISYNNGAQHSLSCDYLRSKFAEITKNSAADPINIISIDIVNDTIRFSFNDGYVSAYYPWLTLFDLGKNNNW